MGSVRQVSVRASNGFYTVACNRIVSPLARERGRVRVELGTWVQKLSHVSSCASEPLTSVLSPWHKGRGDRSGAIAISN
jgi:hypothetical protein